MNAFKELVNMVQQDFPQTQIILLSMKPTLIDDFIGKGIRKNKAICNQKLEEGMHLNALGYTLWDPLIRSKNRNL